MQQMRGFVFFGAATLRDLAEQWWLMVLRGVCAIVFGLLAIFEPGLTLTTLVVLLGAYLVVDGVLAAGSAIMAGRKGYPWSAQALEALFCLGFAALVLIWPGLTLLVAVTMIGIWALISGVAMLVAGFRFGRDAWLLALAGGISVIAGIVILDEPVSGVVLLATTLGIYALLFGCALIGLGLRLRKLVGAGE